MVDLQTISDVYLTCSLNVPVSHLTYGE